MTNQHRILSFDIGIKNLAYCFLSEDITDPPSNSSGSKATFRVSSEGGFVAKRLEPQSGSVRFLHSFPRIGKADSEETDQPPLPTNTKILDWKIVDLLNTEPQVTHNHVCKCLLSTSTKKVPKECGKKAKYQYTTSVSETLYFCESHAKNNKTYLIPKKSHEESALNKLKREGLDKLITEYNISLDASTKITKKVLVEALRDYYTKKSYTLISTNPVSNMTANKIDMITIGRNIKHIMDKLEIITTYNPTHIIMENQISTMASRMKTIQGELTMYFIMKFPNAHIEYISSANKLKHFTPVPTTPVPTTPITTSNKKYRQHKQDAVTYTQQMLQTTPELSTWINTFNNHPTKKDDLADCFLQGIWYLRFRLPIV
uniref:Uncharacterized protein n=1 Tax=viral metagenome TaxID=1070528 RepID=A0A6C0IBL7_9ZZZZ